MILKASQRSGAAQLGRHLMNARENEHVEVHEISGFAAEDVVAAFKEAQAIALGTKCRQHLFSVSLSPPENVRASVKVFEDAINRIAEAHGLENLPRVIVFHEKQGRRHAHAVWSRIDVSRMKAVELPFFKFKLRDISKAIYLEQGWTMPRGLVDSAERDPRNFNLMDWQQAKRSGRDPRELKATIQECWASSDSKTAFENALRARGLYAAKGDRRGHVIVTYEGEVLSIARMVGRPTSDIIARLGKPEEQPTIPEVRSEIASVIKPKLREFMLAAEKLKSREMKALDERRLAMKAAHQSERERLARGQEVRWAAETKARSEQFRKGIAGLWDRMTGEHARISNLVDGEALKSHRRDRAQRDDLVTAQLHERQELQKGIRLVRSRYARTAMSLHRDIARQTQAVDIAPDNGAKTDRKPSPKRSSTLRQGPQLRL